MTRILLLSVASILALLASIVFIKFVRDVRIKNGILREINHIPEFTFFTLDNAIFTNDSIKSSEYIIFLHFNTTCDYCIYETEQIIKYADQFTNVLYLFISWEEPDEIKEFGRAYNLGNYPFIKLLNDPDNFYFRYFGTRMIPSIVIYNQKGELVKEFKGETKIETLLKYMNL